MSMSLDHVKTERLFIRRVSLSDKEGIMSVWASLSQTEFAQYDKPNPLDADTVSRRIEVWSSYAESTAHMFFIVFLADTPIGYIALNRREKGHELSYGFNPEFHHKGYARESIRALLPEIKALGAKQITAGTAIDNLPSVRLLKTLGFILIGTEKVSFYRDASDKDIFFDGGLFVLTL